MGDQWWSWALGIIGVVGFILAGRRLWWAWYINLACQGLWFAYAIATEQLGFLISAIVYTVVFAQNSIKWTKDHKKEKLENAALR